MTTFRDRVGEVREIRASRPEIVRDRYLTRRRRGLGDEPLMLIAADHPARGAFAVRGVQDAMLDRVELLERLMTALARPGVDGVLGTADILDDLLLLGALEDRIVIGSMNRGGLQGASFELDDRFTGFDVPSIVRTRLDGGKMLCRIALGDAGTLNTLQACGHAVTELAEAGAMAMVEPFMSDLVDGRVRNDLSTQAVMRSMAIASGLGGSSARTWLKIPVVPDMERVLTSTTLPTLLLGGDPSGAPEETMAKWAHALGVPGVRGLVVGRALLYPPDGDVASAVDTAVGLVHRRAAVEGVA